MGALEPERFPPKFSPGLGNREAICGSRPGLIAMNT